MKQLRLTYLLILLSTSISFSGCWWIIGTPARRMVTKVVMIVGRELEGMIITSTIEYTVDAIFTAIFKDTAEKSSEDYRDDVEAIPGIPELGQMTFDGVYRVAGSTGEIDYGVNTIVIKKELLQFYRDEFGNWTLTPDSKHLLELRIRVATAQQVLNGHGYSPGNVDGITGPRTNAAVLAMKKDFPTVFGDHPTSDLDFQTQQFLLTY